MTVESIADFYQETEVGQELYRRGFEKGFALGFEQDSILILTVLLNSQFGTEAQVPQIANRLAQGAALETSICAIFEANTLDDLLDPILSESND